MNDIRCSQRGCDELSTHRHFDMAFCPYHVGELLPPVTTNATHSGYIEVKRGTFGAIYLYHSTYEVDPRPLTADAYSELLAAGVAVVRA